MDTERKQQLEQFIQVLGLKEFHNLLILDQALTHSSYANENKAEATGRGSGKNPDRKDRCRK